MLPSIPTALFVRPPKNSRAHNAILRAIEIQPAVHLIGRFKAAAGEERYYRVRGKGRDRHCVIIWYSTISEQEVAKCDCESHIVPQAPEPCFHVAAALIEDASRPPRKLPSMGRKETLNGAGHDTSRAQNTVCING